MGSLVWVARNGRHENGVMGGTIGQKGAMLPFQQLSIRLNSHLPAKILGMY